ncbi:hypothetical protein [Kocuria sabuli]|uniref:hypothetical protein n=1 Tax=Kocuria sabuli TaxID=3071448 RepID=UPI0034D5D5AA
MDVSDFKTLFGDSIRTWLDWDALDDENARVEHLVLSAREGVGELYTVWHVDPEGNPGEWSHPQHRPLTIAQAAGTSWPDDRQEKLDRIGEELADDDEPVQLTVPVYRADDNLVVLDSNHRVVGAYRAEADLRVLLVVLAGPASSLILPGLAQVENDRAGRI